MEIPISERRSISISLVRILATLAIVLCHFQQSFDIRWAWVFNVGVQVFLVLSGFLYGHKVIHCWRRFFWGRFLKLYLPLYLYTTVILFIIKFCSTTQVCFIHFLKAGGVDGLNHLWFMKAIALCYIITPLLQYLRRYANIVYFILLSIGLVEYLFLHKELFTFSWFFLYSMGYFFPLLSPWYQRGTQILLTIVVVVLTLNITWADILNYDGVFNRTWHDITGLFVCFCVLSIFEWFNIHKLPALLKWIDRNSFYLYITHHPLILGPLSLVFLIPNFYQSVLVTSFCIVVCTLLLAYISNFCIIRLDKIVK